jgi:diguanylate cyclase (GGDEF)-like protein/PAS domain S-box-containing protein
MELSQQPNGAAPNVPLRDVIEAFLEQASEGVVVTDRDERIAMMNRRAEELFGYERQELVGKPVRILVPGGLPRPDGIPGWETEMDLPGRHKDGSELPVHVEVGYPDAGGVLAATAFVRRAEPRPPVDATTNGPAGVRAEDGTPAGEAPAETSDMIDPLTGLPGRMLFMDRLSVALARSGRKSSQVAVFLLDLDGFRLVNDSYGRTTGDRVLMAVAERVFGALRPGDTVARIGEDEFAILCDDIARAEGAATIAERVHASVGAPYPFEGEEVAITAGLGFAVGTGRDHSPEFLFRRAETALHRAKARGAGTLEAAEPVPPTGNGQPPPSPEAESVEAEPEQAAGQEAVPAAVTAAEVPAFEEARTLRVREVEGGPATPMPPADGTPPEPEGDDLFRALERAEFRVLYQPIIRLHTGRIAGIEALVRWEHPQRGLVSPAEFMAEAEESGLIHAIGSWVLRQAVSDAERLQASRTDELMLSVNLSARQLADPNFVEVVRGILAGSRIDPGTVYLEVGESSVMEDVEGAAEVLRHLRATGVRMSIDDFGTGFSSLLHLNRFPIDFLKVDRSFVATLEDNTGSANIVTAVISMAHALGLPAIAEGVETDVQLYSLRRLGCDYAQGYLFARPQRFDQVSSLLASDPAW